MQSGDQMAFRLSLGWAVFALEVIIVKLGMFLPSERGRALWWLALVVVAGYLAWGLRHRKRGRSTTSEAQRH
jgi:hypothetical protein